MVVTSSEVIWHELECGDYRADLALWRELADRSTARTAGAPGGGDGAGDRVRDRRGDGGGDGGGDRGRSGRILDVGAGSGRVALELARDGHTVTALDLSPDLLGALRARADAKVQVVHADARSFELPERDFGLCIVAMQTIQLLGGSAGRTEFLRRARAHLLPGGLLACSIVTDVEPFDCAVGDIGPSPERARIDGLEYLSRVTRVCVLDGRIVIERERRILAGAERPSAGARATGRPASERNVSELDLVSRSELEREAIAAGMRPEPAREVAATEEHVGSTAVMLSA